MQTITRDFSKFDVHSSGTIILQKWYDANSYRILLECYNCKTWINRKVRNSNGGITSKDFSACNACTETFCAEIFESIYKNNIKMFEQTRPTKSVRRYIKTIVEKQSIKASPIMKKIALLLTRNERINALANEYKSKGMRTKRREIEGVKITGKTAWLMMQFYNHLTDLEQMHFDARSISVLIKAAK